MSKISDFYSKLLTDEDMKKEVYAILKDKTISDATDDELGHISLIAKKAGFDISVEEAKSYISGMINELDDDDLDAVAGGKGDTYTTRVIVCQVGGKAEPSETSEPGV